MKKALLGSVIGIGLGWLAHSYLAKPNEVSVEKPEIATVAECPSCLEEKISLNNEKKILDMPDEPEDPTEYGKILTEQLSSGGCLKTKDLQGAFDNVLSIYQGHGFEAAKKFYDSLTSNMGQLPRMKSCVMKGHFFFKISELIKSLEMDALRQFPLEDFWKLKVDENFKGEFAGTVGESTGEDIISYLSSQDPENMHRYIRRLCEDKENQFALKDIGYYDNALYAEPKDRGHQVKICRSIIGAFPDESRDEIPWLERVEGIDLAYEYIDLAKEAKSVLGDSYNEEGRDLLQIERKFSEKLVDLICDRGWIIMDNFWTIVGGYDLTDHLKEQYGIERTSFHTIAKSRDTAYNRCGK